LLQASDEARRRLVAVKAQRLAGEALDLASGDLERTDALEMLGHAFFIYSSGDLAWRYYREAAFTCAGAEPPDGKRVARLAALGCDVPVRWPGSLRGEVPAEETVRELWELGMASLPPGDTEERIRLLGVRAGWPFAFSPEGYSQAELEELEAAGLDAAQMALRMCLLNRASAAYDQAIGPWLSRGWYGRTLSIWERRAEIIAEVTDVREIGDFHAMGAWCHHEMARYGRALGIADAGLEAITGRDPSSELHIRAWRIATLYRLGRWDEALDEYPLLRRILDDREDDPPYFATHAFGAVGVIYERRAERVQSDGLAEAMTRMVTGSSGRLYPSLLRFLVVRRELPSAEELRRPRNWAVHAGNALEAEWERLAAAGQWDRAADLVAEMRDHAERADTPTVVAFADRLEARAALARGELVDAQRGLERAAWGFETLDVPWERALTELDIARVSSGARNDDETHAWAARAAATFEQLGDVQGLAAARALTEIG
jgi:tetratricopeptide (TPR) repeat protein